MATLSFSKNGKACQAALGGSSVSIVYLKRSNKQVTVEIPYRHLLAVNSNDNDNATTTTTIHYARPISQKRMRVDSVSVQADKRICNLLVKALQQEMRATERPRCLAVIINPNSGKKKAEKVFYKQVQPLFSLCGIETRVTVTKGAKEARDMLQTMDLGDVDGLVTVGGDGLYCEVMTGLILRTQKDNGVNVHDPQVTVTPSCLPIGLIPAGTGDMVVQYLHGTRDVTTAAVRVLLGSHVATNAVSVHQGGQLSAYSGLVLGFGLQGDMMADCERFRWMGQHRYNVIPVGTVLSRRSHELDVEYEDCDQPGVTQRRSAAMYSVDTYVVSKHEQQADSDTTRAEAHIQHVFGADSLRVHMTRKCPLGRHVQQLTKLKDNLCGAFDYDFMQTARVQSYTVRIRNASMTQKDGQKVLKDAYNINCDGEVLRVTQPEFQVRLHRHAIRLFGEAIV